MKRYSELSILEKINFKSYCVAYRYMLYGNDGFTPMWYCMTVDGIALDLRLTPYQYNKTYKKGDLRLRRTRIQLN